MKSFLIHGAYGGPDENWFPWLKDELQKIGYTVIVPVFPTPKDQTLKNWERVFEKYKKEVDKDTIFVAHSLGAAFALRILEQINIQINACFFVAGFVKPLGNPVFDKVNKTFIDKKFDYKKIKQNCKDFHVYSSDNDPFVPIEQGKDLAQDLGADITIIKDAGHFNKDFGYTRFSRLFEDIHILKSTNL